MSNSDMIVNVWINSQEMQKGNLILKAEEIMIVLESGEIVSSHHPTNVLYSITDDKRVANLKILLNPILFTTHFYAADIGQVTEDIFPPSSGGFYGRLRAGRDRAVYVIQNIANDVRFWLIIGDPVTGKILETQIIHPYEAEALKFIDDQEIDDFWYKEVWFEKEEALKQEIASILDEPSPSWEIVSKLLGEEVILNLKRKKTVRDLLTQLVPDSFPDSIRNQLMAFLAIAMMDRMKMDDLVGLSSTIYASPMLLAVIRGHFRCKVDNVKWPPYVKLIRQSSRGQLEQPKVTLSEFSDSSWRFLWQKMIESFPIWFGNAISSAQELNESTQFRPRLPITKSQALRTKKLWKKRLAAMTYGLQVRGHVNPHAIGLTELIYLGAAYRWPHRHMRFITRLGAVSDNPPHLQVITVPQPSVERIVRTLPQSIRISWSTRVANLNLYDVVSEKWIIPVDEILTSVHKSSSRRTITKRFGNVVSPDSYQITADEAKVLGLVSRGIYLSNFERPSYFRYWNLSRKQVSSIISKLKQKGVVQLFYEVDDSRLVSLATVIQGTNKKVTSLVNSLLTNTPTSLVMLNDQFDKGVVISRFPENIAYDLASKFNQLGIQEDLVIRCMRPQTFRSFTSTLYHRLLRLDGTWDDDVSAFLSQARSKRRELSESNA